MGKLIFKSINGDLEILKGRVQTDNLFLDSNVISLKTVGVLWFDGRIDCSFSIEPHFKGGLVSSIVKMGVSLVAGQVIKLRMTGQIPDIEIVNDYIPVIDNIPGVRSIRKAAEKKEMESK